MPEALRPPALPAAGVVRDAQPRPRGRAAAAGVRAATDPPLLEAARGARGEPDPRAAGRVLAAGVLRPPRSRRGRPAARDWIRLGQSGEGVFARLAVAREGR